MSYNKNAENNVRFFKNVTNIACPTIQAWPARPEGGGDITNQPFNPVCRQAGKQPPVKPGNQRNPKDTQTAQKGNEIYSIGRKAEKIFWAQNIPSKRS